MIARSRVARPALLAATAGLMGCASGGGDGGRAAPAEFTATELRTGERVDLGDHRGRVLILTGWATWCVPCREELPALDLLDRELDEAGLDVIAVNLDAAGPSTRDVLPMVEDLGLTMDNWVDADHTFSVTFETLAIPTNVLLDRDGAVVHIWQGAIDPADAEVRRLVMSTLAGSGDGSIGQPSTIEAEASLFVLVDAALADGCVGGVPSGTDSADWPVAGLT